MNRSAIPALACPHCRRPFEVVAGRWNGPELERALLLCEGCWVSIPVLHGFPLFGEQILGSPADADGELEELDAKLFGDPLEYMRFLREKQQRPIFDSYAAFQPFNESSQSLPAFVPILRERLQPGELILDMWCRTGWSGALLAALFPKQRVLSVWEGDCDVLGYRGYRHWLSSAKRPDNWDVLYHHPDHPLPFRDQAFAFVHGLDTLHRYAHRPLIPECLRVCSDDGVILFPHVHLTNDEPQPFFERGETQLHGTRYREYFEHCLEGSERAAVVLSEKDLFERPARVLLEDDSQSEHYNACVAIVPRTLLGRPLAVERRAPDEFESARVVLNPLLAFDPSTREARIDPEALGGDVSALLSRHPMYEDALRRHYPRKIGQDDCRILYWAERLFTPAEIAARLGWEPAQVVDRLLALEETQALKLACVRPSMAQLQSYYGLQHIRTLPSEETLAALWRAAVALSAEDPYLVWTEDQSVFSYADADAIVRKACAFFHSQGLKPSDRVLLHAVVHPEFHFAFWAAVLCGLVVVPVDPGLSGQRWQSVIDTVRPRLALLRSEPALSTDALSCPTFAIDESQQGDLRHASFLEAVLDQQSDAALPELDAEQPAVVLFTSGSTGAPKGVVLCHGSLYRSSALVDWAYQFSSADRFMSSGGPHTMSGLRNTCLTPLHAGFAVVLSRVDATAGPLGILMTCLEESVTVLNTTPAFLSYCVQMGGKAQAFSSHRLRAVLCTGSKLTRGLQQQFEQLFRCPVHNYYGLTETSGACMYFAEDPGERAEHFLGVPLGSLAWVVDEQGATVPEGDVGELTIYSDNLLMGYLSADGLRPSKQVREGTFHTADLAWRDARGRIVLEGRKDRMLVDRNGENFHPLEIEQCLESRDDVLDSYVMPYEASSQEERFAVLIVPARPDIGAEGEWTGQLETWLRGKLSGQQIPSAIVAIGSVPMGSNGKWDGAECRRLLARHMNSLREDERWT